MSSNNTFTVHKFTPVGDRILVRREETKAAMGNILLPDQAQTPPLVGVVIECGPKCSEIRVGARVIFANFAGMPVPDPEDATKTVPDLLVMREDDIVLVIE